MRAPLLRLAYRCLRQSGHWYL